MPLANWQPRLLLIPTYDSTRIQVKDGRQVEPALSRWNEGDIAQRTGVGLVCLEYSIQQVGRRLGVSRVRDNPKPSDCLRHDLRLTHQLGNRVSAARNTLSRKLSMDVRCIIRVSACGVNCPDVRGQQHLSFAACARETNAGCIETTR